MGLRGNSSELAGTHPVPGSRIRRS